MDVELFSHPNRKLLDHLEGVRQRCLIKFDRISEFINWENVFGFKSVDVRKTLEIASFLHDIGKATDQFQKKMKNIIDGKRDRIKTTHAPISSFIVAKFLKEKGFDDFLVFCGYAIVRFHHEGLDDLLSLRPAIIDIIKKQENSLSASFLKEIGVNVIDLDFEYVAELLDDIEHNLYYCKQKDISRYFLLKLLFSILTSSDREDVVFGNYDPKRDDAEELYIEEEDLIKYVSSLNQVTFIDRLRCEFHEEIANFSGSGDIFSVTAPTGMGKTLANIRLALKQKRSVTSTIVYALPLINIIEQTGEVFKDVFGEKSVLEYHHLSDYNSDLPESYDENTLKRLRERSVIYQLLKSPLVVTTFVSFIEALVGGAKAPFLYRLPGGAVIFDEIQSIPYKKWGVIKELIEFLPKIGIKVVISTATKPVLFKGINVVKKNYYESLCRYKVKVEDKCFIDDFIERVIELVKDGKSTLILMNSIKNAEKVWFKLKEEACFLSSRVLPLHRRQRIEAIKSGKVNLCVSTQVIEAGVDVSFERVIREIAPLDSIIQAAGRCNRSFETKIGEVILIPLMDDNDKRKVFAKNIYGTFLMEKTLEFLKEVKEFKENEVKDLVEDYYTKLVNRGNVDEENFVDKMLNLEFSKLSKFRLIDKSNNVSFLVLVDEYSEKLFEKMCSVSSSFEGIDRALIISNYIKKLSPYIVSTLVYEKRKTPSFSEAFGFALIRGEELVSKYYDLNLGLRLEERGEGLFI